MKKIIFACSALFILASCTENSRSKNFGGKMIVDLPVNQKLVNATWKEGDLWYLTEPMDTTYTPKNTTFHEKSSLGLIEGSVVFIEKKVSSPSDVVTTQRDWEMVRDSLKKTLK